MRLFKILFWCLCLIVVTDSYGQSLFFSNLSTRQGLPSNVINSITQDKDHFIWVGTANGLARFDGYTFRIFKREENNSSLPANEISSLLIDDEHLWVGTWRGLCKINTRTFAVERVNLSNNNVIRTLYKDRKGNVWIGTANGLVKYTNGQQKLYTEENSKLSHNTIRSVVEDNDGNIWVGTYDQLNKLSPDAGRFVSFNLKGQYKPSLQNNLICDIKPVVGNDSLLWIGTETGLVLFNRHTSETNKLNLSNTGFSNEVIKNIYTAQDGRLWLGTDFGLNVIDPANKSVQHFFHTPQVDYSIANNVIWQIYEDTGGVIWLVTSNGLSRINKHNHMFTYHEVTHKIEGQTVGNQVKSILVTKSKDIWIATIHGVQRISEKDAGRQIFSAESSENEKILLNNVFTLEEDDLGRIWIGTAGGINVWDGTKKKMFAITANSSNGLTSNYIARFIKGADGSFWVSAWEGGLFKVVSDFTKLENVKFEFVGDFASEKITYALNSLWGVHDNQLSRIDVQSYVTKQIESFGKIARGKDVYNLYYAPQGSLWAGTVDGLIEYQPNADSAYFHPIITGNETDFNNIISDSHGNIWAAADKFVVKYDCQSKEVQLFPLENDLPLKAFYNNCSARVDDNTVLFGGDNGFISFTTDVKPNTYQPRVFITSLEINNKPILPQHGVKDALLKSDVAFTENLTLDYSQRSVAFGFASLHYWQPDINVFAYKLDGIDRDWKYVSGSKNYAVYSNLSPGTYTMRIRGSNNYGLWSKDEASLTVTVEPPLFLSPPFIAFYTLLAIIAAVVAFRIYVIRLKLKNEVRIARIEKEHAEEIIQAKQEFFTSISHELRTPISLIIPPIQQIIKRGNLDEENRSLITLAEKNSQRLLRLINQILDFRKLEHENQSLKLSWFDLIGFSRELYTLFTDKAARNEIAFNFDPKAASCDIWADKEKIEIIIFNLLSNAFKFTPKKGVIDFSIEVDDAIAGNGNVIISVSDSGIGIAQEEQSRIFEQFYQANESKKYENGSGIGLTLVSAYTKLHKGRIKLRSEKGRGSTFSILLPLGNDHFPVDKSHEGSEVDVVATGKQTTGYEFNLRSDKPLVLLVEDNVDMIDFIVVSLRDKYNFVTAENGEEALQKVHNVMPEVVISDIMMPVMDGLQFCRKIKQDNKTSHIPIILLTAKGLTTQKIEGIRTGADIYMTKPFEIDLLEAHIDHLLDRQNELALYFKHELITQPLAETGKENEDDKFLKKVMNTIEVNIANSDFSVELLSEEMGMSSTHLYRKLKSLTDLSANEIIKKYRIKKASLLLRNKQGNISEIMYDVGFSNLSYFSKCFKAEFGLTPKEYQQKESTSSYDLQKTLDEAEG